MNHEIKEAFAQNKNNILAALRTAGVKKCIIRYSGSGDSGNLDEPDFGDDVVVDDVKIEQTDVTMDYDLSGWVLGRTQKVNKPKPVGLREAIENLCYSKLEWQHGEWQDNEGSQGSFVIDVEAGTINWCHETNYVEVETSEEAF
jgi:hypothetical protein